MGKTNLHLGWAILPSGSGISEGCQDTATACAAAVLGFPGKVSLQHNPETHLQLAEKYLK